MRARILRGGAKSACSESRRVQGFHAAVNLDKASRGSAILLYEMPRPTSVGEGTGLQFRMAVTLFLLGAIYVALVVVLLAVGASGITVAIIAGGLAALNLFASDKLALAAMGA